MSKYEYKNIQPPFTMRFPEMSKRELRAYNTWFHEVMPGRIDELTGAIRASLDYEDWQPDNTVASLASLGEWLESQVETRQRTAVEREGIEATLAFPIDIPDEELTLRTFSLAMDAGMYFGRVVLENVPGTSWSQDLKDKRFDDYGHAVVQGSGVVPLNPVVVMVTTAYVIARGERADLARIFATWEKLLNP